MEQKNKKIKIEELGTLDQREIDLIYYIRTRFKYGEIVVQTRDGLPYRISKSIEFQSLG